MRGRLKSEDTVRLEELEGELGCLGNALVYLRLIMLRVNMACKQGQATLLEPALQDLEEMEILITRVQGRIRAHIREEINPHE